MTLPIQVTDGLDTAVSTHSDYSVYTIGLCVCVCVCVCGCVTVWMRAGGASTQLYVTFLFLWPCLLLYSFLSMAVTQTQTLSSNFVQGLLHGNDKARQISIDFQRKPVLVV